MLSPEQLTGREETHLVELPGGHRLQAEAAEAFASLQEDARRAGFELAIASSFRSFDRQLAIWNAKVEGSRPVHDDRGAIVELAALPLADRVHAILRYSAMPGSSRHHWGSDLDVYDAGAVDADYRVQLSPAEVAPGGVFDPLHRWLDRRMSGGESHGFFRPYARDTGGVAPERWHLSFAPLAAPCEGRFTAAVLLASWDALPVGQSLLLRDELQAALPALLERYVRVPAGWCPRA
jgi:LAS superfamily LD-carboxypeptidase LdcB